MEKYEAGYLYMIKSDKDDSLYFGSTNEINRRIHEHNNGKSPATRSKRPWKLICIIKLDHISHARKLEQILKSHKTKITLPWFLQTIAQYEHLPLS